MTEDRHANPDVEPMSDPQGQAVPFSVPSAGPKRVLVVDDQEDTRRMLERILANFGYQTELARDGWEAMAKLSLDVDLVLLDAEMPGMDGFELARRIRADARYADLPLIMVTGLGGKEDRLRAVEVGVNDFITKPFEINELRLRCGWLLKLKESIDQLKRHRSELEQKVEERTSALRAALEEMAAAQRRTQEAHLDTIRRLVLVAEYRDRDTAAHIERIGRYCELVARRLKLSPGEIELVRHASPMHDVGKIGIPDSILLKPGRLSQEEWEVMKTHTTIGADILRGSPSPLLKAGEEIALTHHERWDGSGYPRGLSGEEIPLFGRICAVADVFDALTTNRRYRDALPSQAVFDFLAGQRGKHFDPQVLDAFLACREEIEEIQRSIDYGAP
jgi:putative two-component system response regulator